MRQYANKLMGELAAELAAGLRRLRRGYVDAAEALLKLIDPEREYPYEFVVYRLTGYRGRRSEAASESVRGAVLRADLLRMMLDVCESLPLRASTYNEPVHDTASLARRFQVSTKTIQRWRRRGLPARRLVFPDGKRRIAFLESSVQWFIQDRKKQIHRSMRFTQMSAEEREDILRRARRMATTTDCRLGDIVKRLASRTGRAMETIRYTVRKHDTEHPEDAIFPYLTPPLADDDREEIYRRFLRGEGVPTLATEYRRTRGSIYRIINEVRATQLLRRPISFVSSPEFSLPDAEKKILAPSRGAGGGGGQPHRAPPDLPPYLRSLYTVPLLSPERERSLFRQYNFLKYQADRLRRCLDLARVRTTQLKRIETLLLRADAVKNEIVRSNLRLVVSIAKRHVGGPQTLFELISDGNVSLMRAVEKFDYTKGFRFSTYASWAIMRNFARSVPKERFQLDRFSTGCDEVLEIAAGLRSYDPNEVNLSELRESIEVVLAQLLPTERSILADHYGLGEGRDPMTLEQLARRLDLSKERVRQIEIHAIKKLRKLLHPDEIGLSP
jgi:RNA polymerase primary sigma factor